MMDQARTLDQATKRERQRIFALLDRCRLSVVDPPPSGLGVIYVVLLPWRPHGERWAYLGRSKEWCLRYLGSGKALENPLRLHARGEFIKLCVGAAEDGPPLIALEEALQIRAGVRRSREDPQHRDWLNIVVNGGGGLLATREQCVAGGEISGPIQGRKNAESGQLASIAGMGGPATSPRYRSDPAYRDAVDNADPSIWGERFPALPINKATGQNSRMASIPKTTFLIEPVSRPDKMNPASRRGSLVALALGCSTSAEYAEGYPAIQTLFGGTETDWRPSFSVIWRMGFVRVRCPDTGRLYCPETGQLLRRVVVRPRANGGTAEEAPETT